MTVIAQYDLGFKIDYFDETESNFVIICKSSTGRHKKTIDELKTFMEGTKNGENTEYRAWAFRNQAVRDGLQSC